MKYETRMKGFAVCAACVSLGLSALADVVTVKEPPVVDGKLDDACWKAAQWESDFKLLHSATATVIDDPTAFAIVTDGETLYVGLRCTEHNLAKLRAKGRSGAVVCSDDIEVFFSPSGDPMRFYQFCVSAPHNVAMPVYHIEGGLTHPDPYAPNWKHEMAFEENAWTCEFAIPLTAFYNTRAEDFKREWVVNVSRQDLTRDPGKGHLTSWSQLDKGFLDPARFRRMKGFPVIKPSEDVAVKSAVADITGRADGKLVGQLAVSAYAGVAGEFTFSSPFAETRTVALKPGENAFAVPCSFEKNARWKVPLSLARKTDGKVFGRTYPVAVDYDAVRIAFTKPAYRSDFYPGQDASKVEGRVLTTLRDPVRVVLEGAGLKRMERTLKGGESFSFDTTGFGIGAATLTVTCGAETRTRTVRRHAKSGRRMSWVENGHLVIDGRPTLARTLYGYGYRCSRPYMARITSEALHLTPEAGRVSLEFGRLVKGCEQKEAIFDDPPSRQVLDAIDRAMDALKGKDFCGYYLCDEPECRSLSPVYLRAIYEHVRERDPLHVCYVCTRDPARFLECADVIEPHPYLCPQYDPEGNRNYGEPLERYGKYFEPMAGRPDKVAGNVSFAFTYREGCKTADDANFDEFVASIWAALAEGVTAFHPFIADSINDNWGVFHGVVYVFTQMEELEGLLLGGRRTRLARTKDYVLAKWEKDGETLVAVVNFQPRARRVKLTGVAGDLVEFRGDRVFRNVWGTDETWFYLGGFETIVASTKPIASKYPTVAGVRAQIARDEYARTHRDNQIFGRDLELEFQGVTKQKICDGILDQQAASLRGGNPSISVGFPRKPVTFDRLNVFGENVEKTTVEIKAGGEWTAAKGAKVMAGPLAWETVLAFPKPLVADAIRLSFHKDKVQVYELEIPYVR